MTQAKFSIGVDLGTSNSVLAYCELAGRQATQVLEIPQYDTLTTVKQQDTLPSFLFLPEEAVATALGAHGVGPDDWIVGALALRRARETPGRVINSAKSWLCHPTADRAAPILPWGSDELSAREKLSPVAASAVILAHLRAAWNARFAARGPEFAFDAQEITVTVPASFDEVAQRLTLDAARQAGFPEGTRLLEEPQAAFYAWRERHAEGALKSNGAGHVLVIDIGGGTSDFSLFEIAPAPNGRPANVKRVAVSDHILLGGDNIDLALAHLFEPRLVKDAAGLSPGQWDHLVARCRSLKEEALGEDGPAEEIFTLSIPGRGSRLVAQSLSAQATRAEVEALILDGFFPDCRATDGPRRALGAIKEFGLPYAFDSAVTRHLAGFLAGRPRVDAVLFNGGSLRSQRLRDRLCAQIGRWREGEAPQVLENARLDLAVAQGAAYSGGLAARDAGRIEAGAARAVFLEAHGEGDAAGPKLVCILPHGAAPEQAFALDDLDLRLRVGQLVRFQVYTSTRHEGARAGEIVELAGSDFQALPPLETMANLAHPAPGAEASTIPVQLIASVNELGLLQVSCRSLAPDLPQTWPLTFNLRPHERPAEARAPATPAPAPAALDAASRQLRAALTKPLGPREKLTASRLMSILEKTLGRARGDWSALLLRDLWTPLEASRSGRALSVEHEESWLILAGFLLRPGFGVPMDPQRMDALWAIQSEGPRFQGKRTRLQDYILWRRVAGGLSGERQEALLEGERQRLAQPKSAPGELIRMAGSFERISQEAKASLIDRFIATTVELANAKQHCAPYLAALGSLLNRTPFYAGPESVVNPAQVQAAYEAFRRFDWSDPEFIEARTLFLYAARAVDDRRLDVPQPLRNQIADKLQKAGIAPNRIDRVRHFAPVERAERLSLYGEALPPGLILND
jgi:molecular chaperone DnaK (HSP70)